MLYHVSSLNITLYYIRLIYIEQLKLCLHIFQADFPKIIYWTVIKPISLDLRYAFLHISDPKEVVAPTPAAPHRKTPPRSSRGLMQGLIIEQVLISVHILLSDAHTKNEEVNQLFLHKRLKEKNDFSLTSVYVQTLFSYASRLDCLLKVKV